MADTNHTPGPWHVGEGEWDGTPYWTVETADGAVVCQEPTAFAAYESGAYITPDGHAPNAALIAVAPDLLVLVRQAMENLDSTIRGGPIIHHEVVWGAQARSALARTKGAA